MSSDELVDYTYGTTNYDMACYFADLQPNTTYTIQRIDSSSRFHVATFVDDVKSLEATSTKSNKSILQRWVLDNQESCTFVSNGVATHLVVYYTNAGEYSTRIMLNEGTTAEPYEVPTLYAPWCWLIDNSYPYLDTINDTIEIFGVPYPAGVFQANGDYPYIDNNMRLIPDLKPPYPLGLYQVDGLSNDGYPYIVSVTKRSEIKMYAQPSKPYIHVYDSRTTDFSGNGYAIIQPISCTVRSEKNGQYNVELETHIDDFGKFKYIENSAVLKVPFRYHDKITQQLFRINNFTRKMDSSGVYRITSNAGHIFYDLSDKLLIDCRPTGKNGVDALRYIIGNTAQSTSKDFARHKLANFPSSYT